MERTCWLIRAGEKNRHVGHFAATSTVAVGWNDVPELADLTGVDAKTLRKLLGAADHIKVPTKDTAELLMFRDDVQIGDAVVTPDPDNGDVLVGEITGDYEYRETPVGEFHHVHTVRWYGRQTRNHLPDDLRKATEYRRTIRRLEPPEAWLVVADSAQAGAVRTLDQVGKPVVTKTAGASASRLKPEPPPGIVCEHCGRQKSKAQYIPGSGLCVDCRTDMGE